MFNAFLTGSHAYGTPHKDSDIDLAILVSEADKAVLESEADALETLSASGKAALETLSALSAPYISEGEAYGSYPQIHFGKLNLILITNEKEFAAWQAATRYLISIKPVTRDLAIATIREFRKGKRS